MAYYVKWAQKSDNFLLLTSPPYVRGRKSRSASWFMDIFDNSHVIWVVFVSILMFLGSGNSMAVLDFELGDKFLLKSKN